MNAPTVTPELKTLLRRVKLGRCLDTLPERLALANTAGMGHAEFLELVLADEVTRRETTSADRRARAAGLDPEMTLERWDDTAKITYDRAVWSNPAVRTKELSRQQADAAKKAADEATAKAEAARKSTAANVRTSAKSGSAAAPLGSMDDTLAETFAAIKARGSIAHVMQEKQERQRSMW